MRKILPFCLLLLLAASAWAQSLTAYDYSADVPRSWFKLQLDLIKNGTGWTPPVASRALGYTGLALYESTVGGMPNRSSVAPYLPGLNVSVAGSNYQWEVVANNCLATIVDSLWGNASSTQKSAIHSLRDSINNLHLADPDYSASRAYGELVGGQVYAWSMTDGAHQPYLSNTDPGYVWPTGPGKWEPTPPAFALPVQPHWGHNRPFVAADTQSPIIPVAPPSFSTDTNSAFHAYAYQVYSTVNNLSTSQENIALYWADGGGTVTPPGHSVSILTNILSNHPSSNLGFAAFSYAKLGMSQTDAFISCWHTKYTYNLLRPITYIRQNIDSTWNSLIATPPFPEYTSGHSTQSGAMTAVMNDLFGATYAFTDVTHNGSFGGNRSFACFDEAAYEAASSRLYGGIHYEFSDVFAITLGKMVGENINDLFNQVTAQSAEGVTPQTSIRFYPNPTTNFSLISYDGFRFGKVMVYDVNGRFVMESANPAVLDLSGLPAGRYMLQILDTKGVRVASEQVQKL